MDVPGDPLVRPDHRFVPGLHGEPTVLRIIRIARVLRLVRFSPGLRTIVSALLRSLPGVGGFLALALVTLYVYGMAGWLIFADRYPEEYGTIGRAVLTLFVLLSPRTSTPTATAGRTSWTGWRSASAWTTSGR